MCEAHVSQETVTMALLQGQCEHHCHGVLPTRTAVAFNDIYEWFEDFGLQNDHPPSPSIAIPQGWFPGKRSKFSAMAAFSGLFIPERPPELRSILMPQSNSCYRHMTEITSFPATYRKSKKPQFPLMWGSPQSGMPSKADIAWDQPNRTSWHCSQGSQKTTDLVWKCHDIS